MVRLEMVSPRGRGADRGGRMRGAPGDRGEGQTEGPVPGGAACDALPHPATLFHATGLPHFQFAVFSSFSLEIVFTSKIE